ncbi:hypothetical protein TURU_136140 [Turdus rufiventris]|nr:hypothetical protein TURU_136140 [Turdus rufiventris]
MYNAPARASSPSKLPRLDAFAVKETKRPSTVAANTGYVPSISRLPVFAKPGRPCQGLRGMMGSQKVAELLTCFLQISLWIQCSLNKNNIIFHKEEVQKRVVIVGVDNGVGISLFQSPNM